MTFYFPSLFRYFKLTSFMDLRRIVERLQNLPLLVLLLPPLPQPAARALVICIFFTFFPLHPSWLAFFPQNQKKKTAKRWWSPTGGIEICPTHRPRSSVSFLLLAPTQQPEPLASPSSFSTGTMGEKLIFHSHENTTVGE